MRQNFSRRQFVHSLCGGFGSVGLAGMLASEQLGAAPPRAGGLHFAPTAKSSIFLFLTGGPSHLDMFDPKPALVKYAGQRPDSVNLRTERVTGGLMPSPFTFKKYGRGGVDVSELLPNIAATIDEICVLRSVYTFNPTHTPARNLMNSGNIASTRPSMGAWISYGLGSENQNLPGFIVLSPGAGDGTLFRSAFLPAEHAGTHFDDSVVEPEKMIRYLQNQKLDQAAQRRRLDLIQSFNREHEKSFGEDEFLEGRIKSMESAFRMQYEAMDVFDLRKEPASVRAEYGDTPFANGCLMARRLIERGVRTVHVHYGPGQPWDDHAKIEKNLRERCVDMDKASAALVRDLKQRGMLGETSVAWGGEFGRTPVSESGDGRDHNPYGFTMWMAGGGVQGGRTYGETDDFGFQAAVNRVSIRDVHATVLRQLGIDHEKLTYRYAGRDFRLTDVAGEVIPIL